MPHIAPVDTVVDLLDPAANLIFNMTADYARSVVASGDARRVAGIDGQYAIIARQGHLVRMARSIGRPMRYFLAKQTAGPLLVIAERMDTLRDYLDAIGLTGQFHPSYTRMVPAHHVVELALLGCPDPNPTYTRFLAPRRNSLPPDLDTIGAEYIAEVADACTHWLDRVPPREPIGVLCSGGIDSGALVVLLHHLMLQRGESPARLKAFTLAIDADAADARQAAEFLHAVDLGFLLEVVDVPFADIDYRAAIGVIEDYKPLDVQAATMGLALCRAIRQRYPDWRHLVDGDGGDENLKDYAIEDNPELTIRSVLNNLMLYQEGWGVDAVKHSLTYSGGQSRGHVRSYAPARVCGFAGFSPFALPRVIAVAERIPFIALTDWDHQRLYDLKGEVVRRGIEAVTGVTMPVYPKRRFQRGVLDERRFAQLFPANERTYRQAFDRLCAGSER